MRHAVVGGGVNLLAVLANLALPAYNAIVARLFGAASYGLYAWANGLVELGARLGVMGSDKALLRHVPLHRVAGDVARERASIRTALTLSLGGSTLIALVMGVLAGPIAGLQKKPEAQLAVQILAASSPFLALILLLVAATMAAKVVRYNLYVRGIAYPMALTLAAATSAAIAPTLAGLCAAHLVATVAVALFALVAATRVYADPPLLRSLRAGAPLQRDVIAFSLPIGVSEFLNAMLQRADLLLLALFVGKAEVGTYAAAELIARAVANARHAFDSVASPVIAEALGQRDDERLRYNLWLMTRWVMLLTFPIACIIVAFRVEFLGIFGDRFREASAALCVLTIGRLFNGALGSSGWVLMMAGHTRLILFNNAVSAAANVVVCLLLTPRFGVLGAAVASATGLTLIQLLQLAQLMVLHRVQPLSLGSVKVAIAGLVTLAGGFLLGPMAPGSAALRVAYGTVALLLAYAVLLLLLGLEAEERALLGKILRRRRR